MFANAHNEYLEAAAEWGLPGLAALAWGLWVLFRKLRRDLARGSPRADAALAAGGVLALALLAAAHFPFRLGVVAFPALLLLARALAPEPADGAAAAERGVSGRALAWALAALLALAVAGQVWRAGNRLEANRILHQVEQVSVATAGRAPAALYWANVKLLRRAAYHDPADSRILLALGGQYLLLGRPEEAIEAYRVALAVEPRPEIYLNLGRAQAILGDREAARESFRRAALLDRRLLPAIPRDYQP
jgi:tetratricopeptide (TPR) repeat protein